MEYPVKWARLSPMEFDTPGEFVSGARPTARPFWSYLARQDVEFESGMPGFGESLSNQKKWNIISY